MRTLRAIGELGISVGLVLLLFYAYLLWGTDSYTEGQQHTLQRQLDHMFSRETTGKRGGHALGRIRLGHALALLRIPRLGSDYKYAIVEGVGADELRKGPGHYPGTAMPGQIGNFVISGHRTTYAAPFNRVDELRRGDDIVVDAADARYTYRVDHKEIVDPTDLAVVDPVPGHPALRPSKAMITMTTCHPKYSAQRRLIVYGVLATREERS
ncbi:class E sortase [Sphaerimonospora cavernae]|uniref:Class E sortase n=1 Tax=Sphaerimonospora cavernae TaxID=1740611 RepID=A0ABV6U4Q0_9ACTN